jgi:hypothetical protein
VPVTEVQADLCFGTTNRESSNGRHDLEKAIGIPTAFEINDLDLTPADGPTPLPAALPLFATCVGALGLLGWRRKRKAQAVA